MSVLPAPAQALLGSDAVAHVWTSNPDGSPQVSVVWVIVQDDEILFGADAASRKVRNIAASSRVVLSVEDSERNARGFQRHLIVHGRATVTPGADPVLMDRLARKYLGLERHPLALRDSPTAVVVRVSVERIAGVGPWVDDHLLAAAGR
ncbi:MAG: TIGR03618 family F420-dependent PPOX class oxidoreductase [Acidimicrobiia bacterium]